MSSRYFSGLQSDGFTVECTDPVASGALRRRVRPELGAVLLGHAEQVGDRQGGERLGVLGEEFALPVADELVELVIDQLPHVVLVLLEPPRRQQPAQQRAGLLVRRRIHDHHVLEDRELVAMRFDLLADVVTVGFERQRRERAADRVDRRERVDDP